MTANDLQSNLPNADMQAAPRALLRASRAARALARSTNTAIVVVRSGVIVEDHLLDEDKGPQQHPPRRINIGEPAGFLEVAPILRDVKPRRLLARIASGHLQNVRFADARALVTAFGFELLRTEGSHHIFIHPGIPEPLNLQSVSGEAKPYQLRQFLRLVERYDLRIEEGS